MCLINRDREMSKADIADRFRELSEGDSTVEDADIVLDESIEDDLDVDDSEISITEVNDRWERRLADWFSHLQYRSRIFGDFYPYTISEDGDVISLRESVSDKHKLYVFFLLSSNLRYVRKYTNHLTKCFETVSQQALKRCLPPFAEVHVFGTSGGTEGRYPGNKWQKVTRLAKDIRAKVILTEGDFSRHDVGDGGLDIVAWIPTGDDVRSLFYIFGQCACTDEWTKKQYTSGSDAWSAIFALNPRPFNVVFIPFCYRNGSGDWFDLLNVGQSVIMDRVRMMYFLTEDYGIIKNHAAFKHIEEVVSYREDIV